MDPPALKNVCIRSCEGYRSFIEEQQYSGRKSGRFVYDIEDISIDRSGEVTFHVSQSVRTINDLFLMIGGECYYNDRIHDLIHDTDKGTISMYPDESVIDDIRNNRKDEIKLVSDLKWLIDITQSFYEKYGHLIRYPDSPNDLYGREEFRLPKDRVPSEEQLDAVEGILNDMTSYVWGTPGAGKTQYVLATAIMTCVDAGERVAVIAPTNSALEQVLRGLISSLKESDPDGRIIDIDRDVLRLGTASQSFSREFPNVCEKREVSKRLEMGRNDITRLEGRLDSTVDSEEWERVRAEIALTKDRLRKYEEMDPAKKERRVRILAMTPQRLMMRYSPDGSDDRLALNVDRIFLDEAGYTSLINTLPLFSFGVPVSFLGDHMQLPPVCEIEGDTIMEGIRKDGIYGDCYVWTLPSLYAEAMLTHSEDGMRQLFLKRSEHPLKRTNRYDLRTSYRFGERLADILDELVYERMGLKGNGRDDLVLDLIDVEYNDRRDRDNLAECEAIMKDIMDHGLKAGEYAILTPYRKQVRMFRNLMNDEYSQRYDIFTIHRSQGREWDTVYLSVVDNDTILGKEHELHLTSTMDIPENVNTINTAISRAKKRLVIVCDAEFWRKRKGDLIGELVQLADNVSYFRHKDSDPICFRDPHITKKNGASVPRYHNKVEPNVPKRIYAAFRNGDIDVSRTVTNMVYDYCEMTMVTDGQMHVVDHILKAHRLLCSRDYEEAEDELREALKEHNALTR